MDMDNTLSLPAVQERAGPGAVFVLTRWSPRQLKVTFLPALVQAAVNSACRIVLVVEHSGDWPPAAFERPAVAAANLTNNDIALDVVLESEARDASGQVTLTWLRAVDKRTGRPLWAQGDGGGHRLCIVRVSAWAREQPPGAAVWRAFWDIFQRYANATRPDKLLKLCAL
jgi:hypothetical protein